MKKKNNIFVPNQFKLLTLSCFSAFSINSFAATGYSESYVYINSFAALYDTAAGHYYDNPITDLKNNTGDTLELQASGTNSTAFWNRNNSQPGYIFNTHSETTYAKASLATGELKTTATVTLGSQYRAPNVGAPTIGGPNSTAAGSASAEARIGDTFTSLNNNNTSFLWGDTTQAMFNFDVHGLTEIPVGLAHPESYSFVSTRNQISTILMLRVYQVGAAEVLALAHAEIEENGLSAEFYRLDALYGSMEIENKGWIIGDSISPPDNFYTHIDLDSNNKASVSHTFSPGGDFEWSLSLQSLVYLDGNLENISVIQDFSNTIKTSYIAPDGATTYSASGFFPGTLAISAVPESETYVLMMLGLGLIGFASRNRLSKT